MLTDHRLIFATTTHGVMVDLTRKEVLVPVTVNYRWMMARLVVEADEGTTYTFAVSKAAARDVAFAVNGTHPN